MDQLNLILGPPGTGKTTRLLTLLEEELANGVPLDNIAFVTFTRAARADAVIRAQQTIGDSSAELPWFRTIHSTALKLLRRYDDVMQPGHWKEFADRHGYKLTAVNFHVDDDPSAPPQKTEHDKLRAGLDWCRARRIEFNGLNVSRGVESRFFFGSFQAFADRLNAYKAEHNLVDFGDMLELSLGDWVPVEVAFIDEAQDLCPAEIACVESWFAGCQRVYVAGDDDQAIYGFRGADPAWLLSLNDEADHVEVLSQSYRVPQRIHAIAHSIIKFNRQRVVKEYRPRDDPGEVVRVDQRGVMKILRESEDAFLLARNRFFLWPWARQLRKTAIPWGSISDRVSPLDRPEILSAIQALMQLRSGRSISASEWQGVLRCVTGLPRGMKAWAARSKLPVYLDSETGLVCAVGQGDCAGDAFAKSLAVSPVRPLTRLSQENRAYLERLLDVYGEIPRPTVRLGTWHAAKGLEAETVVVIPDMQKTCYKASMNVLRRGPLEAERRLAYVAVTRAREKLVLVRPVTKQYFSFPGSASIR